MVRWQIFTHCERSEKVWPGAHRRCSPGPCSQLTPPLELSEIGCFSFYPGKNLGAYGEGGAITTNDDAIAARVRILRDHAQTEKYRHEEVGFNYRMDGLQGAILGVKLRHLDAWNAAGCQAAPAMRHS